jgi:hypothetical protein
MHERSRVNRHAEIERSPEEGIDWSAVLLELVPLTSILLVAWALVTTDGPFGLALIPLAATGAGWWKIGRFGTGCALAVARGIVLFVLFVAAIFLVMALGCAWNDAAEPDCNADAAGFAMLASIGLFAVVAYLVPIASAILVARASSR